MMLGTKPYFEVEVQKIAFQDLDNYQFCNTGLIIVSMSNLDSCQNSVAEQLQHGTYQWVGPFRLHITPLNITFSSQCFTSCKYGVTMAMNLSQNAKPGGLRIERGRYKKEVKRYILRQVLGVYNTSNQHSVWQVFFLYLMLLFRERTLLWYKVHHRRLSTYLDCAWDSLLPIPFFCFS